MKGKSNLVLVIDDEVEIQRLLQQRFRKQIYKGDIDFQFAENGLQALEILKDCDDIDMVLTDIRMPEMDGLTLLSNLAKVEHPLKAVVVSAFGDMKNIRTAMNRGAFDFLTKPVDFKDLELTINKTLEFVSHMREQQQQLADALGKLQYQALYDQLTGLPNRNGLLKRIAQIIEVGQSQAAEFALLMLDVEQYSTIKSGFGHKTSDRLIVEVARRLDQEADDSTVLARTGENIFAVLWHSLANLDTIHAKVGQLLKQLESPFALDEITVTSTTRSGIALSSLPYVQAEDFFQAADTAMQTARQQSSSDRVIFDVRMQETAIARLNLEVELQKAIKDGQMSLNYQPIFQINDQRIVSLETLVRWTHPTLGRISPVQFIPLAEETGLIIPLGDWILAEACKQFGHWKAELGANGPDRISINLSNLQLQSPTLLQHIDASLNAAGLTGEDLTLEITESVLMENGSTEKDLLAQLRERQIKLSIDDFGTGYSSLSYLQKLPINALKIDKSFIEDIEVNSANLDITSTIITLAHHLDLDVVAEGLEKEEHMQILNSLSCQCGQGYVFSRPLDVETATAFLQERSVA